MLTPVSINKIDSGGGRGSRSRQSSRNRPSEKKTRYVSPKEAKDKERAGLCRGVACYVSD